MRLLCCITTRDRPEYSEKTIRSFNRTKNSDDRLVIVDNASEDSDMLTFLSYCATVDDFHIRVVLNKRNLFPGAATNIGWHAGSPAQFGLLMRSDNDIEYLPGWRDEVEAAFTAHETLGQLGTLNMWEDYGGVENVPVTEWTENNHTLNIATDRTGGNCVIRRELWDQGLRWQAGPWRPGGNDEDTQMSRQITELGYRVARVIPTIANNQSFHRYDAYPSYYDETARLRGLVPQLSV